MDRKRNIPLQKADLVLLLTLVGISSGLITFNLQKVSHTTNGELMVEVRIAGKVVEKITESGTYTILDDSGQRLTTLHFDGKHVWVEGSTCPDKICEKMGKVSEGGSIICVPNRMIIELKGQKRSVMHDVQTW